MTTSLPTCLETSHKKLAIGLLACVFGGPLCHGQLGHGAEPDVDLAVKLLLKWPNLYYSTSAFAPKYWPEEIIKFANSRGSDKVIYGGYFPMGLELSRIFAEMNAVPFKEDVWPKFLRDNAAKVLGIDAPQ